MRWSIVLLGSVLLAPAFADGWVVNGDGSYGGRIYEDGRVIDANGNQSGRVNGEWIINNDGSYGGRIYEDGRIIRQ